MTWRKAAYGTVALQDTLHQRWPGCNAPAICVATVRHELDATVCTNTMLCQHGSRAVHFCTKVLACADPHTCNSTGPGSSASSLQAHTGVSLYSAPVLPLQWATWRANSQSYIHGLSHFCSCCDGLQSKAAHFKLEMPDSTFPRFMRANRIRTGHRYKVSVRKKAARSRAASPSASDDERHITRRIRF